MGKYNEFEDRLSFGRYTNHIINSKNWNFNNISNLTGKLKILIMMIKKHKLLLKSNFSFDKFYSINKLQLELCSCFLLLHFKMMLSILNDMWIRQIKITREEGNVKITNKVVGVILRYICILWFCMCGIFIDWIVSLLRTLRSHIKA